MDTMMEALQHSSDQQTYRVEPERAKFDGLDIDASIGWGEYPMDSVFIRQETRSVAEVINRIKNGRFILDPEFKRAFVWTKFRQSKLIESCIMRVPIPAIYAAETDDGRIAVIDGMQRLTTLDRFINNKFSLDFQYDSIGRFEHPLSGMTFNDLSIKFQERIEDTFLVFYTLDAEAPEWSKLDIFERVNSGIPMTRQQMRNAIYYGPSTKWLKMAANSKAFQLATANQLNSKTMRDREAINRFVSFTLCGWRKYSGNMDAFLADGLRKLESLTEPKRKELLTKFEETMSLCYKIFAEHTFKRSILKRYRTKNVINVSLFEVISVTFYKNLYRLEKIDECYIFDKIEKLLSDSKVIDSITKLTNSTESVKLRHSKFELAVKDVVKENG